MMVVTAMQVTPENMEYTRKYDAEAIVQHLKWMEPLHELGVAQGIDYFVVLTYRYNESTMGFDRDSMVILDANAFYNAFVFVESGKKGFVHAVHKLEVD